MTKHTAKAFRMLALAYPFWGEKFGRDEQDGWSRFFEDMDPKMLIDAVEHLVKTTTFPPSPGEIRATAERLWRERRHNGRTMADVMAESRRGGC